MRFVFHFSKTAAILTTIAFLTVFCGREKTEEGLYKDVISSLKYKTYKLASSSTVPPAVQIYNSNLQKGEPAANEMFLRLLLGYNWAVTNQAAFAFAEADIITDKSMIPQEKFLAQILRSIVMYEQGWNGLAKEESDKAIQGLRGQPDPTAEVQLAVFHLLMASLFIKENNFDNAKFHFAGFGEITGINWPYMICDAAADIQRGDVQGGLKKVKKITQDPSVPPEVRSLLAEQLAEIEKTTGDVNSSLFWPKAISSVLFKELKNASNDQLRGAVKLAVDLIKRLRI